jgi:hypothetical protein
LDEPSTAPKISRALGQILVQKDILHLLWGANFSLGIQERVIGLSREDPELP